MPPGEAYPSVKIHTGLDKVRAVVHDPVIKSLRSNRVELLRGHKFLQMTCSVNFARKMFARVCFSLTSQQANVLKANFSANILKANLKYIYFIFYKYIFFYIL